MIDFELKIHLCSFLKNNPISIKSQNKILKLKNSDEETITINASIDEKTNRIELLNFSQFKADADPHIIIKKMSINGFSFDNFNQLLSFDMQNNQYVENITINEPQRIDFNGSLYLEIKKNYDRIFWFDTTFSKDKKCLIYTNNCLNCDSEYGCWHGGNCNHTPPWQQLKFEKFVNKNYYDIITLGCSITFGSAILKKQSWPQLISQNKELLNLGVPGGGIDQIFLNAQKIIKKKIKFDKMIILLPVLTRKVVRVFKHGFYFNILLNSFTHDKWINQFNIYFTKDELKKIKESHFRKNILSNFKKRNEKIIKRLLSMLEKNNIKFYISSWNDETYSILKSLVKKENLLPLFNESKDPSKASDGIHPSEKIHKIWANQIKSQISH